MIGFLLKNTLFPACGPNRPCTMDPYYPVGVGFRDLAQQPDIRLNEFRAALPAYAEHLRRFHAHSVVRVRQQYRTITGRENKPIGKRYFPAGRAARTRIVTPGTVDYKPAEKVARRLYFARCCFFTI